MTLPRILAQDLSQPDTVILRLELAPDLVAFDGHFPGAPILPGVVQVDWAVRFAVIYLAVAKPVARDFQVKFRQTICPGEDVRLTLRRDSGKNRLSFSYDVGDAAKASGVIMLEPRS